MAIRAKDVLLHVKNKLSSSSVEEKTIYPITRWENILGAPRILDEDSIENAFPSEYALYMAGDISISDEEYEACFGEL